MRYNNYTARLASSAWREFTQKLRQLGGRTCTMCGATSQIQVHHMRYKSLGMLQEWKDCCLLCDQCHDAYHARVKVMPAWPASRMELLLEVQLAVTRTRSTAFFDRHGDAMSEHWLKNRVVVDALLEDGARGRTKREKKKRRAMYWNSKLRRC